MKIRGKADPKPVKMTKVKSQKKDNEYHALKNELNFYLRPTVARTESMISNPQNHKNSDSESESLEALQANVKIRDLCCEDKFKVGMLMKKLADEQKEKEEFKKRYEKTLKQYNTVVGTGNIQAKKNTYLAANLNESSSSNEYYDIKNKETESSEKVGYHSLKQFRSPSKTTCIEDPAVTEMK